MAEVLTFRERATKGFAWNYLYKFTEFGLMNLYTILVVRHFGPSISAPYAIFTALGTTLAVFGAFAVDGVLLRYMQRIAVNEPFEGTDVADVEKFGLSRFLQTLFAFRILAVIAVSFLVAFGFILLPRVFPSVGTSLGLMEDFIPYLILLLFIQSTVAFCTLTLIGLLETKSVFFTSLISRGVLLVAGVVAVYSDWLSIQQSIILYVGSAALNAMVLLFALVRELEKYEKQSTVRFHFKSVLRNIRKMVAYPKQIRLFLATPVMLFGITAWGSDLLTGILGKQPDILMMGALLGEHSAQIGYYSSASIILLVTEYVFLLGLGGTLVSIFSKLAHDDEKETGGNGYPRLVRARKEIFGFQNVVLLPLVSYMMFFAPDVIRTIYGNKFDDATLLIRIGLAALTLSVGIFGGGLQITSLGAIGKPKIFFRTRLFWGVTNLVANYFLIQKYGALGAIIGTQFANAFACGTEGYFAGKMIGDSINLWSTFRIIVISGTAGFASYLIVSAIGSQTNSFLIAIEGVLISAAITIILYSTFKVPEARDVWRRIRSFLVQRKTLLNF